MIRIIVLLTKYSISVFFIKPRSAKWRLKVLLHVKSVAHLPTNLIMMNLVERMKYTTHDDCDKQKIFTAYNLCRPPDRLEHDLASIGFRQTKHI